MSRRLHEAEELLPGIASMVLDRTTSTARVVATDGQTYSMPLHPPPFSPSSVIVQTRYVPSKKLLFLETDRGHTVEVELPTLGDPAPLDGRRVVYLDQRDWSLLANVQFEPKRVRSGGDRDAAEQLIALAYARKIVLPLSLAHLAETAKWSNTDRRYRLAITMARLSRGWQMRHPIDIRQFELRQSFATRIKHAPLPPLDVFTLEGRATERSSTDQEGLHSPAGFPEGIEYVRRASTRISSFMDVITAAESVPMVAIPEWVSANQRITELLASQPATTSQKREDIGALFLRDMLLEIAKAALFSGVAGPEATTWVKSFIGVDVRSMRSLGLFKEIYQDKHLDGSTKWYNNDLLDMLFLTCAAGYADFVLGERKLVGYARQAAKRLGRPDNAYSQIGELLVALRSEGL